MLFKNMWQKLMKFFAKRKLKTNNKNKSLCLHSNMKISLKYLTSLPEKGVPRAKAVA